MRRSVASTGVAIFLATLALLAPLRLVAQTASCPLGYTVLFFNGVGNTYPVAVASMHATQAAIRESRNTSFDVFDAEDVQYDVAYNTTASQTASLFDPINTTILQDIAEVFVQRAKDLEPGGAVGNNFFYMFWEWVDGVPQNYSNALGNNAVTNNFFANFQNAAVTVAVGQLAKIYGAQAPTQADYALQEAQLTAAANAGRKLLLVAHSQGNLFANHGYNFILPSVGTARLKLVHVAPATVTVNGDYELSSGDVIINGLRLVNGFASIVDPNINPPLTQLDQTGHGYNEIYLSSTLVDAFTGQTDRVLLEQKFTAALNAMDQQQCTLAISPLAPPVKAGDDVTLTATLTPPLNPANLEAVVYKWTITGAAGGSFTSPLTGAAVPSVTTTVPNVTYNASSDATDGQTDSVAVEVDVSTLNDNNATSKDLADTQTRPAVMTIGQTNGCYDKAGDLAVPGSTYSVASKIVGSTATVQENASVKVGVAFADPPYATTAYELDTTKVRTYPDAPASNLTTQTAIFSTAPTGPSWVIYGSNEDSTTSTGTAHTTGILNPPLAFGRITTLVAGGAPISVTYAGSGTSTTTSNGVTKTVPASINYTESWKLLGTPTINVDAGTFKTCAYQITTSINPNNIDTKWEIYGYGIEVQESSTNATSGAVEEMIQATSVSINGQPYTGP